MENWDLSAVKTTKVTEKINAEFRMEFFNLFNHPQFSAPSAQMNGRNTFGSITSTNGNSQPRLGQMSLRLSF